MYHYYLAPRDKGKGIAMKYYAISNSKDNSFTIITVDDNGKTINEQPLTKRTSDGYLYLPQDVVEATNRRMVGIKFIENNGGQFEVTWREYKAPRTLGVSKNNLEKWMSDDDKAALEAIMKRAYEAKEAARAQQKQPKSELEKAQAQVDKWMKKVNELMNVDVDDE